MRLNWIHLVVGAPLTQSSQNAHQTGEHSTEIVANDERVDVVVGHVGGYPVDGRLVDAVGQVHQHDDDQSDYVIPIGIWKRKE